MFTYTKNKDGSFTIYRRFLDGTEMFIAKRNSLVELVVLANSIYRMELKAGAV